MRITSEKDTKTSIRSLYYPTKAPNCSTVIVYDGCKGLNKTSKTRHTACTLILANDLSTVRYPDHSFVCLTKDVLDDCLKGSQMVSCVSRLEIFILVSEGENGLSGETGLRNWRIVIKRE